MASTAAGLSPDPSEEPTGSKVALFVETVAEAVAPLASCGVDGAARSSFKPMSTSWFCPPRVIDTVRSGVVTRAAPSAITS
ncbi:MAG TPA: hypothetical protein VGJ26_15840, partial [Pirellulales bacterium]